MGTLRKQTAKMMHHDSITGSSLVYIIYNETIQIQQTIDNNNQVMTDLWNKRLLREQGLKLTVMNYCTVRINERNLCPHPSRAAQVQSQARYLAMLIYNPSIHEQEYITFTLPFSKFTIEVFNTEAKDFNIVLNKNADFDTLCSEDPDGFNECEVIVNRPIAPLGYELIKVTFNNADNFETKEASFGFKSETLLPSPLPSLPTPPPAVKPVTPPPAKKPQSTIPTNEEYSQLCS